MKHIKVFAAIFLAALMFVQAPVRTLAENEKVYLKEVSIGYGESGKQKLKEAGYTVYEDLNANDGGTGESVWIGYKTTTVKSEGITDLAVMNMNGGYSISEYQNMIADLKKSVQDKQNQILDAVEAFGKNYAAGSDYAKAAMKLFDCFYYEADDGTQIPLGELFTANEIDKDAIYKMCLEGNTDSLNAIVSALSLGIIEYTGDTVATRLEKLKYGVKSGKTNVETKAVTDAVETFKLELLEAEKVYNVAAAYEGGIDKYLENKGSTNEGNLEDAYMIYLYQAAKEIKYGTTGLTLLEAMMLPLDPPDEEIEEEEDEAEEEGETEEEEKKLAVTYFDSYMIDMMTKALTFGQIGVIGTVGLGPVLFNAYAVNYKTDKPEGTYKTNLDIINEYMNTLEGAEKISVFDGVDRSLIENPEDVAITTEALRKEAKKKETDVGRLTKEHWTDGKHATFGKVTLGALALTVGAGAAACALKSMSKYRIYDTYKVCAQGRDYHFLSYDEASNFIQSIETYDPIPFSEEQIAASSAFQEKYPDLAKAIFDNPDIRNHTSQLEIAEASARADQLGFSYSNFAGKLYIAASTIAAVAMVITIIFTVFTLIAAKEEKKKQIEYTKVPRAIVDQKTDANEITSYVVYYATKQVTATATTTEDKALYGDLNAFNKYDQWLVLYYSKDSSLGEPLTPNMMVRDEWKLTDEENAKYVGIHDFGYKVAKDLNYYNNGTEKKNIYVFFERSIDSNSGITPSDGSLFNLENGVIAISFLALGALGAAVITYCVMKKKRKEEVTA